VTGPAEVVERSVVRVVLLDAADRLLLFHTHGRLPALLPAFLAGEIIDEPFERWS
jgi:hypothetical protein